MPAMMLMPDVVHQLNLIAFEGWEYHKLPLESLGCLQNSQLEEGRVLLTLSLPGQPEPGGVEGTMELQNYRSYLMA